MLKLGRDAQILRNNRSGTTHIQMGAEAKRNQNVLCGLEPKGKRWSLINPQEFVNCKECDEQFENMNGYEGLKLDDSE